jgi:hypothetical protein
MDELIAELEACRRGLGDGEETIVLPAPARPRRARRSARRLVRTLVLSLLALLLVGAAAVGAFALAGLFDSDDDEGGARAGSPVAVQAVGAFDPFGTGGEHDGEASLATDKDPSTYWTTETYEAGLQKEGVGLILDAGTRVRPTRFLVTTDTPGFKAEIRAGEDEDGPFEPVSSNRVVTRTTTFAVETGGARYSYFVIWITELQPGTDIAAHVNEARARAA